MKLKTIALANIRAVELAAFAQSSGGTAGGSSKAGGPPQLNPAAPAA